MDGSALPLRRLLVADGREQRVREVDLRLVQGDYAFPGGCFESLEDAVAVAVGRRHHVDRRPDE